MTQSNQIPACPSCKRRPQDGHDSWCPNYTPVWVPPTTSSSTAPTAAAPKPEPLNVAAVVVPPAPMTPPKAEPKPAAASLSPSVSRAPGADFASRPASPRPPERIETLPSGTRPDLTAKPATASIADAGIKPALPSRPQAPARPAAASLADAGLKPLTARTDAAVRPASEPTVAKPVRPEPAPVAKAPKAEPAAKVEAKAKPEPIIDGEHRCEDCNKTEAETTFPRKGDWVSKVCRSCRKARGLRP